MKNMLDGMEEYKKNKAGRQPFDGVTITKSGWLNITREIERKLKIDSYNSVELLINKEKLKIGLIFRNEENDVYKYFRLRKSKNSSTGFYVRGLILKNKEFLGRYKLTYSEKPNKTLTAIFEKIK